MQSDAALVLADVWFAGEDCRDKLRQIKALVMPGPETRTNSDTK